MDSKEALLNKLEVDIKEGFRDKLGLLDIKAQPEDGSKAGLLDTKDGSKAGPLDTKAGRRVESLTYVAALDSTLMRCIPKRQVEFEALDIKVPMEAGSREMLGTRAGRREESPTRGSAQAIPEGLPTRGRSQMEVGRSSNRATAYSRRRLPMTRDTSSMATKTASNGSLGSATTFRQNALSCTTC